MCSPVPERKLQQLEASLLEKPGPGAGITVGGALLLCFCGISLAFWAADGGFLLLLVHFWNTGPQGFTNSDEIPFCRRLKSSGVSKSCCCLGANQHLPCLTLFSQILAPSWWTAGCTHSCRAGPKLTLLCICWASEQKTKRNSFYQLCNSSPSSLHSLQTYETPQNGVKEPPGFLAPSRFSWFPPCLPWFHLATSKYLPQPSAVPPSTRFKR